MVFKNNSQIKPFPPAIITEIAEIMALKDMTSPNYLKGPQLVELFKTLGFMDSYTFIDGLGFQTMDLGERLSRKMYTTERLNSLNRSLQVPKAIKKFLEMVGSPREAYDSILNIFQKYNFPSQLDYKFEWLDNHDLQIGNKYEDDLKDENPFLSSNPPNGDTPCTIYKDEVKNEKSKFSKVSYCSLDKKVLGDFPEDCPVVFISYSWDTEEHKNWVRKLADDLQSARIYVLLDQYVESGTNLADFMSLGIKRADKVIIVGTPKYVEKTGYCETGVAFEGSIINSHMFKSLGSKKFIPCLRKGEFKSSFPETLSVCKGHNFVEDKNYDKELEELCREIWGKPKYKRPPLGEKPDYVKE